MMTRSPLAPFFGDFEDVAFCIMFPVMFTAEEGIGASLQDPSLQGDNES